MFQKELDKAWAQIFRRRRQGPSIPVLSQHSRLKGPLKHSLVLSRERKSGSVAWPAIFVVVVVVVVLLHRRHLKTVGTLHCSAKVEFRQVAFSKNLRHGTKLLHRIVGTCALFTAYLDGRNFGGHECKATTAFIGGNNFLVFLLCSDLNGSTGEKCVAKFIRKVGQNCNTSCSVALVFCTK